MPKFFVEKSSLANRELQITGGDAVHIAKVLRLSVGSSVILCDGEGMDYEAEICGIEKNAVHLRVLRSYPCLAEPEAEIILFQGIPKASKMEYIIQKCTELGMAELIPVMTKRTVVKLEDAKAEAKKLERWNKISAEAVKQCGRGRIPRVGAVADVSQICSRAPELDLLLVAYEEERTTSLKQALRSAEGAKRIGIVIGPEGGFEQEEIKQLAEGGAISVSLGKRILRTETAGHTVLTAVLYELGELE